ncbi:nickel transporter permease [Inediibacterium massiliense]|uniref:nickel transporter permease n=1 Tax=Inediibacterium massiliense TaxID=1658111 RepID=UPI001FA79440|nr:nickel transporter permease [Inediibacterium massiliense]
MFRITKRIFKSDFWYFFFKQKKSILGFSIIIILCFAALCAPWIAPNDPLEVNIANKLQHPNAQYWLGTDNLGRCVVSRLIFGTRNSLFYSVIVLIITLGIGIPIGMVSGYIGGKVDLVMMRIIDLVLALPSFMVALAIAGVLGPSTKNMLLAMCMVWWSGYARFFRGLTIQMKESDYIMAAISGGCSHIQIIFRHLLKNMIPPIIILATLEIGSIILAIATFSFIGLGIQPPIPEWGIMLSDSKDYLQSYPQLMFYPGIVIVVTVMSFNLLGRGMRNAMQTTK